MTEATCRRELDLEIPAQEVEQASQKVAKQFARVARVPGFRPGKAPLTLIRRRFAEDIKGEVLQSLVPEHIEKAVTEQKLSIVTRPQLEQVDWVEGGGVKFRAIFEVLPEIQLGDYKSLEVEVPRVEITDQDVDKGIEDMRERAATYVPVEDRAIADGDFAVLKLVGMPADGGEPIHAENILCHIGGEETLAAFNENLRGAKPGEHKRFDTAYPEDYPDQRLAKRTFTYAVDVLGIKEKKLPARDDAFAKDVSEFATLAELRAKLREKMEAARDQRQTDLARERILAALIEKHDFPVPEAMVEQQMDQRLERTVRQLAAQGLDPRSVNVDWVALRKRQRPLATGDVKAELLLDRIATAEKIDVTEEEVNQELEHLATHSGESAQALRARLTKQGALDRMKSKLRSDKTLAWLHSTARIRTKVTQ
jgi:trigger factor